MSTRYNGKMKIILSLFLLSSIFRSCKSSCEDHWPSCGTIKNVACLRRGQCGSRGDCIVMDLDDEFRQLVLDEHNRLRNKVAQGQETRGGNGEAANMMVLSYDLGLEYTAICTVQQCKMKHDLCRRTKKFTSAGQNLHYITDKTMSLVGEAGIRLAINNWYEESNLTEGASIKKFPQDGSDYAHFTQLAWANTTYIGCARSQTNKNYFLACNYGNSGNEINQPVYIKGKRCSRCPDKVSCNTKYKALCGKIDETAFQKTRGRGGRGGGEEEGGGAGVGSSNHHLVRAHLINLGLPLVLVPLKIFGLYHS
ncbi:hypothetical protein JTB14_009476 [Gonioctena quinquepunctata]|nr:hypothetical protein JTB14_009476 [Gonioctena quinquepunctata]